MKFKIDENLPKETAEILRQVHHDAFTIVEQNLGGRADSEILSICKQEGRALVTLDLDFADIRLYPPKEFPGIIILKLRLLNKTHIIEVFRRLILILSKEPLEGNLWIVEEDRVRIRD
jgi:predicted nuclease of predicted toxin-antitoxin system